MTQSLSSAIRQLNFRSRERWGDSAPQYSVRYTGTSPRTYYVNRHVPNSGPWIPADDLFARGPREHCLAKVNSAINHTWT